MSGGAAFRGQPLLLFGVVIAAWGGARVVTWETPPTLHHASQNRAAFASLQPDVGRPALAPPPTQDLVRIAWSQGRLDPYAAELPMPPAVPRTRRGNASRSARIAAHWPDHEGAHSAAPWPGYDNAAFTRPSYRTVVTGPLGGPQTAAGAQMLPETGGPHFSLPGPSRTGPDQESAAAGQERLAASGAVTTPLTGIAGRIVNNDRLSLDSWMFMRQGGAAVPTGIGGSYGGSQSGFVARYDLFPGSRLQPRAYLRASRALAGLQDSEIAVGVSVHPLSRVPVSVAGEMRYYRSPFGEEYRPAVYAVTHLPPQSLPWGLRGEAYFQGGYVGGQYATPFIDGQLRADREFIRMGRFALRAGGGVWGGAQKGAERFDIGPAVSLLFSDGKLSSRLSLDYRFRVAGDATPGSGTALTLSAGF